MSWRTISKYVILHRRALTVAVTITWLATATVGLAWVLAYEMREGDSSVAPMSWPIGTRISADGRHATLLMFVHPHCPCTRASLSELEKLMARHQNDVKAWVVLANPPGADEHWDQTDLLRIAASIPGVQVVQDINADEARRFHARTSGQTLLYDRDGDLVFNGGITLSRGHAGDNPGRDAIEAFLDDGSTPLNRTAVFGCPIIPTPAIK